MQSQVLVNLSTALVNNSVKCGSIKSGCEKEFTNVLNLSVPESSGAVSSFPGN